MALTEKQKEYGYKGLMSFLTLMVMLCFHVFDTDAHAFVKRASGFDNVLGLIFFIAAIVAVWLDQFFTSLGEKTGWTHGVAWVGGTLLGCVVSAGFNFDYFGI